MAMEDRQRALFVLGIVFSVVTSLIIALRVGVRLHIKGFGWDDALMVVGQIFAVVTNATVVLAAHYGVGVHEQDIPPMNNSAIAHAIFAFENLSPVSLFFIKTSICLAMYRITKARWIQCLLCAVVVVAFSVVLACVIGLMVVCNPVSDYWLKPQNCSVRVLNYTNFIGPYLSVTSVLTDFVCASLPFVVLWNVQMKPRMKAVVIAVLSMGFLASVATFVRLGYRNAFFAKKDLWYGVSQILIWSIVEINIGVIVGSMPALMPLLRGMASLASPSSSNRSRTGATAGMYDLEKNRFNTPSGVAASPYSNTFTMRSLSSKGSPRAGNDDDDDSESLDSILGDDRMRIARKREFTITTSDASSPTLAPPSP